MQDRLDQIPWPRLTHAYGPAGDVPDLLLGPRTAQPDMSGERSPLWQLFGNIWHQGTVYEATAYAVPFLIELAADPRVPDRQGILQLLALIATGGSYLEVHAHLINKPEPDFAKHLAQERRWAERAHVAVESGATTFLAMTHEETDIRLAAAYILALLPGCRELCRVRLRSMLDAETKPLQRAGLLLLLGLADDRSAATLSLFTDALAGADPVQRRAATIAIARLKPNPLPGGARHAILEAIATDDLEESFHGLPWDPVDMVDRNQLYACLDAESRDEAAKAAIIAIESGTATDQTVSTVLDLLFPRRPARQQPPLTAQELSLLQHRAVRAIAAAMQDGRRIFAGYFPQWGLPNTGWAWRALASGEELPAIILPLPTDHAQDTSHTLKPEALAPGQRVLHRTFGPGTIVELAPDRSDRSLLWLTVRFDDAGLKTLTLPRSRSTH